MNTSLLDITDYSHSLSDYPSSSALKVLNHIQLPDGQYQVTFEGDTKPVFLKNAFKLSFQNVTQYFAQNDIDISHHIIAYKRKGT